jgi:phosphatidylserine/phosphatidylglycerophosphate/cardiolipin synthase-like enzyme
MIDSISKALVGYQSRGFSASQLADVLDLLRQGRELARKNEPKLDLVWTGPDPEKFVDRDAAVVVMDLFQTVQRTLILSTFVIYNGVDLFAPLHQRMVEMPNLEVSLFVDIPRPHDDSRTAAVLLNEFMAEFRHKHWPWDPMPEVYFDPRSLSTDKAAQATLHAKVVVADGHTTLITSANLTHRGQNRNIEAGVRIESPAFARTVSQQFYGLIEEGLVQRIRW